MSKYYDLSEAQASKLALNILTTVDKNWQNIAKELKISSKEINLMKPAFHFSKNAQPH